MNYITTLEKRKERLEQEIKRKGYKIKYEIRNLVPLFSNNIVETITKNIAIITNFINGVKSGINILKGIMGKKNISEGW